MTRDEWERSCRRLLGVRDFEGAALRGAGAGRLRERARRIDLGLAVCGALTVPGERRTLAEMAAYAGCSRERIRQVEEKALAKLRDALAAERQEMGRDGRMKSEKWKAEARANINFETDE